MHVSGFSHTCVENAQHLLIYNCEVFLRMCAFSRTYVLKSKHVWKKAPRCKYTNVFVFFQTCWVKVKDLEEDIPFKKMIGMIQNDHSEGVVHSRFSLPMLFHRSYSGHKSFSHR